MPRLDCVINENVAVLMEDRALILLSLFVSTGGIWQLKSPRPREIAIYPRQKIANVRRYRPLGAGRSWN